MCGHTRCNDKANCIFYPYKDGQQFRLVAPLLQQRQTRELLSTASTIPYSSFYDLYLNPTNWVWATMAQPQPMHALTTTPHTSDYVATNRLSAIETLPYEILDFIIELLCRPKDVISLSLTSNHLWQGVISYISGQQKRLAAPWAGQKIALIGNWIGQSPPQFLVDDSTESIDDVDPAFHHILQSRNNHYLREAYNGWEAPKAMHIDDKGYNRALSTFLPGLPEKLAHRLKEDANYMRHFPQDRCWVLRNLTTKEFVKSDALKEEELEFHHILLSNISWIDGQFCGKSRKRLCRGAWAGHRFDIVVEEQHEEEVTTTLNKWTDVGDKAVVWAAFVRDCALSATGKS